MPYFNALTTEQSWEQEGLFFLVDVSHQCICLLKIITPVWSNCSLTCLAYGKMRRRDTGSCSSSQIWHLHHFHVHEMANSIMYDKKSAVVDTEFQMFEFENGVCCTKHMCYPENIHYHYPHLRVLRDVTANIPHVELETLMDQWFDVESL